MGPRKYKRPAQVLAALAPPQSERQLQIGCHKHFRTYCPKLVWEVPRPGKTPQAAGLGWMNKNDGKKNEVAAGLDKAQGLTPGVPDWQLAVARQGYHGLFIEFKTTEGVTSPAQDLMHEALRLQGYLVREVRSLQEFGRILQWYLGPSLYLCKW